MPKTLKKTRSEYAEEYQVTPRTITRWIAKGYPLDDPAQIRQLEAAQKSNSRLRAEIAAVQIDAAALTQEQLGSPPDLAHAMVYHRILNCRKLSHELRELKAQTISRDEVEAGGRRVHNAVKTVLLGLPGVCGELVGLEPASIQKRLATWVHASLTELSNPKSTVYAA